MYTNNKRINIYIMAFLALTLSQKSFSEYIEAIDTTDTNGFGIDSAFKIGIVGSNIHLTGHKLACYSGKGFSSTEGAFKYNFDEINLAADSVSFSYWIDAGMNFSYPFNNYCFVIEKYRDSTFFKVLIINRLEDNRYVFKFGTNTTPRNRVLVESNYDRTVRYKPNNLFYLFEGNEFGGVNRFYWEPPLPNDNHLLGYIIYIQKKGVAIDTNTQINLAQWDSVGFTDTITISYQNVPQGEYFNIVAVYTEGKADFLKGWSRLVRFSDIKKHNKYDLSNSSISIKYIGGYLYLALNQHALPVQFDIFNATGKHIVFFNNKNDIRFRLNISQRDIPPGLYLLRAEFPDRSVITQPFTIMW